MTIQVATPDHRSLGGLRELPWATTSLRALAFCFEVRCNEAGLADRVASLLCALRAGGAVDHCYDLVVGPDGRVEVSLDGRVLSLADSRSHAVAWLLWHISQAAVEATRGDLLIHAGAVETAAGALLLPAPPDAGKTTLTAALVRAGLGYLTDEVVAIPSVTNDVRPFPRPLTLEPASFAALVDFDPGAASWSTGQDAPRWYHVPAARLGPAVLGLACPPRVVVFPRYRPGAPTRLQPIGAADAVLGLATNAFNLDEHGGRGLRQLAGLAEQCACFRLDVSDLADACRVVLEVAPRP
jgi:hypothetical protein